MESVDKLAKILKVGAPLIIGLDEVMREKTGRRGVIEKLVGENEKIIEGVVEVIYSEDLDIRLLDGTLVRRKWWEIKKL